jgi:hypothetical protein
MSHFYEHERTGRPLFSVTSDVDPARWSPTEEAYGIRNWLPAHIPTRQRTAVKILRAA